MNWKGPLKAWADEYRKTLEPRVQDLIRMARWDLNFGPSHAYGEPEPRTEWPGFEKACMEIIAALDDAPRRLWVDMNCEECLDVEPSEIEPCYQCEGNDPECELCHGHGEIEACLEDVIEVDRRDILRAIVGNDLAEYVR